MTTTVMIILSLRMFSCNVISSPPPSSPPSWTVTCRTRLRTDIGTPRLAWGLSSPSCEALKSNKILWIFWRYPDSSTKGIWLFDRRLITWRTLHSFPNNPLEVSTKIGLNGLIYRRPASFCSSYLALSVLSYPILWYSCPLSYDLIFLIDSVTGNLC